MDCHDLPIKGTTEYQLFRGCIAICSWKNFKWLTEKHADRRALCTHTHAGNSSHHDGVADFRQQICQQDGQNRSIHCSVYLALLLLLAAAQTPDLLTTRHAQFIFEFGLTQQNVISSSTASDKMWLCIIRQQWEPLSPSMWWSLMAKMEFDRCVDINTNDSCKADTTANINIFCCHSLLYAKAGFPQTASWTLLHL